VNGYTRNRVYAFLCCLAALACWEKADTLWAAVGISFFVACAVAFLTAGYVITYGKQK
jgi:hypothetical protein